MNIPENEAKQAAVKKTEPVAQAETAPVAKSSTGSKSLLVIVLIVVILALILILAALFLDIKPLKDLLTKPLF